MQSRFLELLNAFEAGGTQFNVLLPTFGVVAAKITNIVDDYVKLQVTSNGGASHVVNLHYSAVLIVT